MGRAIVGPFGRPEQLGDVPRPDLIRSSGQQLWLLVVGMLQLIAALTDFMVIVQDAVHRANRAVVRSFVQQGRVDRRRRFVDEPL